MQGKAPETLASVTCFSPHPQAKGTDTARCQHLVFGYHKLRGLKTTDIYSFTALEAKHPKLRCPQGRTSPEGPGEELFLASSIFWRLLVTTGFPWLQRYRSNLALYLLISFASVFPCVLFCHVLSLIKAPLLDLGPTLIQYDLTSTLTLITLFLNMIMF